MSDTLSVPSSEERMFDWVMESLESDQDRQSETPTFTGSEVSTPILPEYGEGDFFDGRFQLTTIRKGGRCALAAYAHDTEKEEDVFIKAVGISEEEDFFRFSREIRTLEDLDHPQIPAIYESQRLDNNFGYAVLEPKPDATVRKDWEERISWPWFAASVCASALEPTAYLHNGGLVHRDIKPDNLAISFSGTVALTDFEGAVRVGNGTRGDLADVYYPENGETPLSFIFGTPGYLSPEQASGLPLDNRSDIYAMGSTMFRFLYGYNPVDELRKNFNGNPARVHVHVLNQYRFLPRIFKVENTRGRAVPDELAAIIEKATEKKPENRYDSAEEMQEELQAYIHDYQPN